MDSFSKQKWEDLNLSRDELKRIGQALQKEEFRSLLLEYVKEINDPENRKQYEKEITQLENERGVDIKFVHPSSGYVLKTSINGKGKAFINICSNNNVGKPSSTPDVEEGQQGLHWYLPYCLAPPREDVDKKNNACKVYDVVFHPDTLHLTKTNVAFKKLVNDTALRAVEDNFHVGLDKNNIKFPKMQFKGMKHATVIRKKIENFQPCKFADIPNYPYPTVKEVIEPNLKNTQSEFNNSVTLSNNGTSYTTPKYSIKHLNTVDMQDYTNDLMSKMFITVPNELVIVIDLPLLKCYTDASLEITENTLYLVSENPKYKLNLNLPYTVDSNKGNAKFDAVKKILTVTLPVIKQRSYKHVDLLAREDSGVESDNYNGRSNSVSSGDEDGVEKKPLDLEDLEATTDNRKTYTFAPPAEKFLKSDIHYVLPNFSCQLLNNLLTFTLQVSNVKPESVEYCFLNNAVGYHLTFFSMGAGFFFVHYAFCLVLPQNQIKEETLNVEVWDNNVIAQIVLTQCDTGLQLSDYFIGTDENNVKKFMFPTSDTVGYDGTLKKDVNTTDKSVEVKDSENGHPEECIVNGTKDEEEAILKVPAANKITFYAQDKNEWENYQPTEYSFKKNESKILPDVDTKPIEVSHTLPEEEKDLSVSESASSFHESTSCPHRKNAKLRTVSESQQGDIMQNKNRGILKIGRSLSESSVDDYVTWSSKENNEMEKTKKTVRFSEVICKQVFRMNSSILGQRKKNQRKTKNKKRAQERRLSESGGESEGESEAVSVKGINSWDVKQMGVWLKEDEELSSCDVSEVSEASDISESDDGLKVGSKPQIPCSNRKNHKRRGKKSARKNAATAKLQFMEN